MKTLRPTTIIPPELYVERAADRQLERIVTDMGRPGYVLVARQMGKTNLLLNMKRRRESFGDLVIYLDLSNRFETVRALFRHIIDRTIQADPECLRTIAAERTTSRAEPNLEYDRHLRLILKAAPGRRLILVLDEIDSLTNATYSNAFFAQIRSMYFARINHAEYNMLTYVLSGVAEPTDLIKDKNISPFNIGEKIYLEDFTESEVTTLIHKAGLSFSPNVIAELYDWIGGNPRMTWDVCSELEDIVRSGKAATRQDVEDIIDKLYLGLFSRAPIDHIRTLANEDTDIRSAMAAIRSGRGQSLDGKIKTVLFLAGISRDAGSGTPKLRNRVIDVALADTRLGPPVPLSAEARYDLFLSYNRADLEIVQNIAQMLRRRGLTLFFDRWASDPGQPWQEALGDALTASRAFAVFVGSAGMTSMQNSEYAQALRQHSNDSNFTITPVLLPGAEPGGAFLNQNTWVDLRESDYPIAVDTLIRAARGVLAEKEGTSTVAEVVKSINPYRGLASFREEQAPLFFGREASVRFLIEALSRRNFIAVVGRPGSGKSSLVQAGVVPALRRWHDGRTWAVVTMAPGPHPVQELAASLAPLSDLRPSSRELFQETFLAMSLAKGRIRLGGLVEAIVSMQRGTERLLLVIDEWEEIYTLCSDKAERQQFIDILLDAVDTSPLSVMLTLRSDFFSQALAYRPLSDALQGAVINISPMTREELRRVIIEPARLVGLELEDGLAERILEDVGNEPDSLPILEFVLGELWETREAGKLLHAGYEAIGRGDAMAKRAEDAFSCLSPQEREAAQSTLVQLVNPGEGAEDTRRRAPVDNLSPIAREAVEKLCAARLLVITQTADGDFVEFAHEAIIRNWPRLRNWVDEDRDNLRMLLKLERDASDWQASGKETDFLWTSGRRLEDLDRLSARSGLLSISPPIQEFMRASIAQARELARAQEFMQASITQARELARARRRLRLTAVATFTLLALLAMYSALRFTSG